jgi:1-acyl-sn-glycerol-3-phosphate acyltransferase
MIRAVVVYMFVGSYILILGPVAMLWTLVARETLTIYRLAHFCVRAGGWLARIKVRVRGREKIVPGQTYVVASNHQGNFDGPLLLYAIKRDLRVVVKSEMMSIPVFNLVMKQVKCVAVDRRDAYKSRESIDRAAQLLTEGYNFITFPEGTRSRDGRLGPFKKGAFIMAIKAQIPVLPVTIVNSRDIQKPGEFAVHKGTVDLVIHDPIVTKGMTMDDRDRLLSQTRAAVESGFGRIRGRTTINIRGQSI